MRKIRHPRSVSACPQSSPQPWTAGPNRQPALRPQSLLARESFKRRVPGSRPLAPVFVETVLPKHFPRHCPIIKRDGLIFQDLVGFMALARQDDDVSFARLLDGTGYGGGTVRLDNVPHVDAANADQSIIH